MAKASYELSNKQYAHMSQMSKQNSQEFGELVDTLTGPGYAEKGSRNGGLLAAQRDIMEKKLKLSEKDTDEWKAHIANYVQEYLFKTDMSEFTTFVENIKKLSEAISHMDKNQSALLKTLLKIELQRCDHVFAQRGDLKKSREHMFDAVFNFIKAPKTYKTTKDTSHQLATNFGQRNQTDRKSGNKKGTQKAAA